MSDKSGIKVVEGMMTNLPIHEALDCPLVELIDDVWAGAPKSNPRPPVVHEVDTVPDGFEISGAERQKIIEVFRRMPPEEGRAYLLGLIEDGKLERDIDLSDGILLNMTRILGRDTFDRVHTEAILHLRGAERVAQAVTDTLYAKLFIKVFGVEGVPFLPEEFRTMGKRRVIEDGLGL